MKRRRRKMIRAIKRMAIVALAIFGITVLCICGCSNRKASKVIAEVDRLTTEAYTVKEEVSDDGNIIDDWTMYSSDSDYCDCSDGAVERQDEEVNYEEDYLADDTAYYDNPVVYEEAEEAVHYDSYSEVTDNDIYSGDSYADSDYFVDEVDGWTYIHEPSQWNSTYMGVHKITDTTSAQWKWLQTHDWYENEEGIISYDGRILVALTPTFGSIGSYVDLLLEDGTILYCIIGDVKANSDTYGHWHNGQLNVIELIVAEWWYEGHENKTYPNVVAYR